MFTHLHVHTEFSMLDGLSRLEPLVLKAKELGMNSLAITDHGGMYGVIDFYRIALKHGIKPIIGCEMYVAPGSRHSRDPQDKSPYHITILAKNAQGYHNLIKLVTLAHLEGFYYKPRVDRESLEQYHEGLIVLSGCPSGEVPNLITQGRMDEAKATATWYKELFGDYYLELMEHGGVPELPAINNGLLELNRELGIPVVATNDSHYVDQADAPLQDILICIHTNTNVNDEKRMRMTEDSYFLKNEEEMQALYPNLPEAIANTQVIADMCNLELDFTKLRMPEYKVPGGVPADKYLADLCWDALQTRIDTVTAEHEERLAYELEVIKQTQYANYFLVVWDIAKFVRDNDIFFAVRGSAAASMVLFCLRVTDINPLPYRLVFERFLNVERKEMPDIDMDFQDDRREEVLKYVVSKYGRDHVAQIITFGTLGARASIRDVGRALAVPYADTDRIARLVPFRLRITLDEAIETSPEFKELYDTDESVKNLVDTARKLEGLTRHSSTHAAGVVISEEPLDDVVPLQRPIRGDDDGITMTQYSMEPVAALGLLKMDFLGLVNLTVLAKTRGLLENTRGFRFRLQDIPLNDANTFDLLARGDTVGVFQLEGAGMTRYIKELKPTSLADVAAMIALYRPGPMEHIGTFIDAKYGRVEPNYPHPALKDILEETYGVIVFQDQVLLITQTFAGYTLGEADIVRKAMGKKIPEIMAEEREKFLKGAVKQGYTQELAEQVFALIEPFAGYAFNKAHSVSYGLISYWTAYLKANYPVEYMVALLNGYMGNTERTTTAVVECRRLQIKVLPPDIRSSDTDFTIETLEGGEHAIRFGLAAIKNVGAAALKPVLESRQQDGPFTSIEQMCRSCDLSGLNRKTLESLIKVGAFDAFGGRAALLTVIDRILSLAQSEASLRDSNQTTMFDLFGESVSTPLANIDIPDIETPQGEARTWELELLGLAMTGDNRLNEIINDAGEEKIVFKSQLGPDMARKQVAVVGQVSSVIERYTRDQRPFRIVTLDMMDGQIEVFVWEEQLESTRELWKEGMLVMVGGTVRVRDDQISISCTDASEYKVNESKETEKAVDTEISIAEEVVDNIVEQIPTPPTTNGSVPNGTAHAGVVPDQAVEPEPGSNSPLPVVPLPVVPQPVVPQPVYSVRRLRLRLTETQNIENDQGLLDDVKRLLMEHRGEDEVTLEIAVEGRIVTLEWPPVRVNASTELHDQLLKLLGGSGSVTVEGVTI